MRFSRTTGVLTAAVAVAAAVAIPGGIASADTPPTAAQIASAAHTAVPAPVANAGIWGSYMLNGKRVPIWLGSYTVYEGGKPVTVICVSPKAELRTPTHFRVGDYGTKETSARLNYIMFNWGTGSSGTVTAGAKLAMFAELGIKLPGLEFQNPKDAAPVATYVKNDLYNAARYSGFGGASMIFGAKVTTPGQKTGVKMVVDSATGHQVPGIPDRLTAGSATVAAYGRSGEWSTLARTSTTPVWAKGTATIASGLLGIGTAGAGAQTLISAVPLNVSAKSGWQNHAAGVKSTVFCNCDGTANITGHVSQAAGSAEGQYTMLANGKVVASVTIPAGKHGQAAVLKAENVADGALVTFTARYKVDGKWTATIALGGTFKNVCPVMPRVSFTTQCNCKPGTSTYTDKAVVTVANPSRTDTDTVTYAVDGVKHTLTVAPGASKTAELTVPAGPVSFAWSWTASV